MKDHLGFICHVISQYERAGHKDLLRSSVRSQRFQFPCMRAPVTISMILTRQLKPNDTLVDQLFADLFDEVLPYRWLDPLGLRRDISCNLPANNSRSLPGTFSNNMGRTSGETCPSWEREDRSVISTSDLPRGDSLVWSLAFKSRSTFSRISADSNLISRASWFVGSFLFWKRFKHSSRSSILRAKACSGSDRPHLRPREGQY